MNKPEERITAAQNIPAARALEVVKLLIEDSDGRESYKADPQGAFDARRDRLDEPLRSANYGDIPDNSRRALEALSVYELQLLSDLDRTFVEDGLWVDVPSPGRLMFK